MKNFEFEIQVLDNVTAAIKEMADSALRLAETLKAFGKRYPKKRPLFFSKHSKRMIFSKT